MGHTGVGAPDTDRHESARPVEPGRAQPLFVAVPPASWCDALNREVWADRVTFHVGELHLGVRTNDADLGAQVRAALRKRLAHDVQAPANFSVKLAPPVTNRRNAGFHFLYRNSAIQVRTRDVQRLVRGLLAHLATFEPSTLDGLLTIDGVTLVHDEGALIAPAALRQWLAVVERRLNLRGLRIVDAPAVLLDPARREVVLPDAVAVLGADPAVLDAIDAPAGRPDPPVPVGRYPVTGWAFLGTGEPITRAHAVALASRLTLTRDEPQPILDALAHVVGGVEPGTVPWAKPPELVAALAALA